MKVLMTEGDGIKFPLDKYLSACSDMEEDQIIERYS